MCEDAAYGPALQRPAWGVKGKQDPPSVPILVSDFLLHLSVRQRLQQGAPLVGISRVADGDLHGGQGVLAAGKSHGG